MVIYHPEWLVLGMVHGLIGVAWMGVHVGNELTVLPQFRTAQKLADLGVMKMMPRISKVGAALGFLTLLSGLAFFLVKWGFDTGNWFSDPEARTVLIALGVVLVVLIVGMGVLRPSAMALGKKAATLEPMAPLPDDFKAGLKRVEGFLHLSSALVTIAFLFMIVALNGGI